ncbi:hypothetical protein J5J86_21085 [Aquabacter sp. L1I39]|uniref:hypothetical protein n=1 Tax=Aquabacter sp. L1I39 TaxID=2820278 RepID=UPI001AD9C6D8|nr:hypothetical protein [Aquabacter sp. L1I39]QTL03216.1 hypothetical protein J5J86_21085 [Aquabacter sp. L1I39]
MRVAPLLTIAAALMFAGVGVAEAQSTSTSTSTSSASSAQSSVKKRTRTTVDISKRSPLDAGTVVKPGSKSYLDYALPSGWFYPTYGAVDGGFVPGRYPLPGRFDLPGY